jgi:hypothetical protein
MRPRGARIAGALEGQDANGDGGARATAPREVEAVITKQDAGFARRFRGPHAALGGGRLAARAVPPRAGQRLDIRCGAMHMATSLVKTVAATYER